MYIDIKLKKDKYKVYYETYGSKEKVPLIMLHGWKVDSRQFKEMAYELDQYYIILIDFLGFGKSDTPYEQLHLHQYVYMVREVINHLRLKNYILLGHSFGGRVAIKYAAYYQKEMKKLILVDSAGISKKDKKTKAKIKKYKILKKLYFLFNKEKYYSLINNSGSNDYKGLSPFMKKTMSNVINENLEKYLKKITIDALILWGLFDLVTPIHEGRKMNQLVINSRMIVFYESSHFPYNDETEKFLRVLKEEV